eukprot:gene21007-27222_t
MSECYSDWLFNNFNTIFRKDSTTTNLDVILKINEVLGQANPKIIWLIIDGFPAFYQPMLESILKESGINKTKTDWSFAVLPTITEVCIPTMLSGKFESAITERNRNQLLVTASNHKKCTYTSQPRDFRQNISADVDIACIHATVIDAHLHKNDSEFVDGRESEIKRILKTLIEPISEVIKSSTERPIKLVISTDHGATKCLENGKNIKNSKLSEAAKENPRERCFRLNGKIKKENIDASEMYLLTKEVSRNMDDWAIARGYRYFGRNDSGYRHGGLSPEETIVPIMFCEISNIQPVNLLIKYLGVKELVFGKTERDFTIQIKNTNATNIELIEVSILEDGESIEQKYTLTVLTEKDEFDVYESACIDKSLYSSSGLNEQSIPVFVGEWLIDRQMKGGDWDEEVKQEVIGFVKKFMPSKDDVEDLKQRLRNGDNVSVLEYISPKVSLEKDQTFLESGSLGNQKVYIEEFLLTKFPRLLKGGLWGLAIYSYRRNDRGGEVWLNDFKPLQAAAIDFEDYAEKRTEFNLEEWIQIIINSLGYNAEGEGYSTKAKRQALLTRLLPFVQRRVNLFELAPKGTGKSFLFGQFSRYSRLIEGGAVSPAVLFYNENTKVPGLFTQFDVVVFDEAQSLSFTSPDETVAKLKGYLEQGKYSKGKFTVSADSGAVFIANVQIDSKGLPTHRNNLFGELPEILQESALLDRIHGILPGWNLPRMSVDALSKGVGFKADFLGEIFHSMRNRIEFDKILEMFEPL